MALSVKADETALDLFRRASRKPLRTGLVFLDEPPGGRSSSEEGMGRGDVVEIYGGSGSGKTELLMNVIAQHVLPAWLGGEEQTAFFFDNDGRFSILRLEQLLRERIANNTAFQVKMAAIRLGCSQASGKSRAGGGTDQPEQVDGDIEDLLARCLKLLRVVRPSSLFELLASLEVLRFELKHQPAIVAVDGMGSFYWQDKMAHSCGGDAVSMQGAVIRALVRLVVERPVVLFATKSALFAWRGGNKPDLEHREYLPQAWQRSVTHRIILERRQHRSLTTTAGTGAAFSLFTARVSRLKKQGAASGASCHGGSIDNKRRKYFFVITDDGIHDVPAVAAELEYGGSALYMRGREGFG